jgi:hypothetical protein
LLISGQISEKKIHFDELLEEDDGTEDGMNNVVEGEEEEVSEEPEEKEKKNINPQNVLKLFF